MFISRKQMLVLTCRCDQTFTSRGRRVNRVTGRTARAHGGTVRSAIGTGLGNAVGTRARVR